MTCCPLPAARRPPRRLTGAGGILIRERMRLRVDQHPSANYHYCINQSRPATPEEYADLKTELEGKGHTLRVIQQANYQHHEKRRQTATALTV